MNESEDISKQQLNDKMQLMARRSLGSANTKNAVGIDTLQQLRKNRGAASVANAVPAIVAVAACEGESGVSIELDSDDEFDLGGQQVGPQPQQSSEQVATQKKWHPASIH